MDEAALHRKLLKARDKAKAQVSELDTQTEAWVNQNDHLARSNARPGSRFGYRDSLATDERTMTRCGSTSVPCTTFGPPACNPGMSLH